jgi:hypothetical protein
VEIEEALGLVDHLKEPPPQVLAVGRVEGAVRPGESGRVDLRVWEMLLRLATEEEEARQGRVAIRGQVPVGQQPLRVVAPQIRLPRIFEVALESGEVEILEGEAREGRLVIGEALRRLEEPEELLPGGLPAARAGADEVDAAVGPVRAHVAFGHTDYKDRPTLRRS